MRKFIILLITIFTASFFTVSINAGFLTGAFRAISRVKIALDNFAQQVQPSSAYATITNAPFECAFDSITYLDTNLHYKGTITINPNATIRIKFDNRNYLLQIQGAHTRGPFPCFEFTDKFEAEMIFVKSIIRLDFMFISDEENVKETILFYGDFNNQTEEIYDLILKKEIFK